jgi:folate-binding protein YgfZ
VSDNNILLLESRRLLRVSGEDSKDFLQNVITNDMNRLGTGQLLYACLLTPQGRFLHDFFIFERDGAYMLDVAAARAEDLLRRLNIFKLRAKVVFGEPQGTYVYAVPGGGKGVADPRRGDLGARLYDAKISAGPEALYDDFCIAKTVPAGATIHPEQDTMADVSLDLLNAVAWDKGCFIGQEVAARMHHRGLAKRRLFTVTGKNLQPGPVRYGEIEAGDIRQASSTGDLALAVLKVTEAEKELADDRGGRVALAK